MSEYLNLQSVICTSRLTIFGCLENKHFGNKYEVCLSSGCVNVQPSYLKKATFFKHP